MSITELEQIEYQQDKKFHRKNKKPMRLSGAGLKKINNRSLLKINKISSPVKIIKKSKNT